MLPIYDGPMRTGLPNLETWANGPLATLARRAGFKVPALSEIAKGTPAQTRVNHNRWIVDCPDCGGAEFLWPENLMMCANCWNQGVGGLWRRVEIPDNGNEIETVLKARPVPATRNWERHETVAHLKRENQAKGLPERLR